MVCFVVEVGGDGRALPVSNADVDSGKFAAAVAPFFWFGVLAAPFSSIIPWQRWAEAR